MWKCQLYCIDFSCKWYASLIDALKALCHPRMKGAREQHSETMEMAALTCIWGSFGPIFRKKWVWVKAVLRTDPRLEGTFPDPLANGRAPWYGNGCCQSILKPPLGGSMPLLLHDGPVCILFVPWHHQQCALVVSSFSSHAQPNASCRSPFSFCTIPFPLLCFLYHLVSELGAYSLPFPTNSGRNWPGENPLFHPLKLLCLCWCIV